ncbi:DUF2309 domain-containing protein [Aquisphaera insulae]|uniref:DUF2309 domain-containing protein n=1 Tax=Aquisphaera insulae TaxID=2712864 RepID=UPI0013EE1A65|nr:DUF2309 domain-containing protein [Aquisphaera insulae]
MNAVLKSKPETSLLPTPSDPLTVDGLVARASDVVAPVWPLKTFIAVNPLQGLEDRPFEQAVLESARHQAIPGPGAKAAEAVNRELIKWCAAFFDEGQATIPMPNRHLGLYRTFADLARYDRGLRGRGPAGAILDSLPASAEEAIAECLGRLRIPKGHREEFIRRALAMLPGWSGYVKWYERWQRPGPRADRPATLVDYVAVRLVLTCLLGPEAGPSEEMSPKAPAWLAGLPAAEARYRESLLARLRPRTPDLSSGERSRPAAQLAFCIDVRSEPLRRAIEAQGRYETLGFAGFFGLPVRVGGYGEEPHDSCPVLLRPAHEVCEHPADADPGRVRRHDRGRSLLRLPAACYRWLKYNFATPFALVEILGPWLGLRLLARTFAPSLASEFAESAGSAVAPPLATEPALDAISLEQRAAYGEGALRMMGLTQNLAPLVVFCGHGSRTSNNAYASALDCGACGGHHGGPNARILAAILNDPRVRTILDDRGLPIPRDTIFLAGEHNTTTDRVELYRPRDVDDGRRREIESLIQDLAIAGARNARGRCQALGQPAAGPESAERAARRRSADWAEVRPEWGLARNAAFIVGPRELTRAVDLEGRCFLHSYDWESDEDGRFLTTILTAPMVVAQWINSQYLFSTLDNVAYGSGSKVTQNVTGKIGVTQGNASDLMHGLPLQSVHLSDDRPQHEPLRLLTVVLAPRERLDAIIRGQEVLRKLFGNGWVTLACLEPAEGQAYLLTRDLTWERAQ